MIMGANQNFQLMGNSLKAIKSLDYETQPEVVLMVKGIGKDIQQRDVDITANFTVRIRVSRYRNNRI